MFKIGDRVIGNELASKYYGITREGWTGTVVKISESGKCITVKDDHCSDDLYTVKITCFDIYPANNPSADKLMKLL